MTSQLPAQVLAAHFLMAMKKKMRWIIAILIVLPLLGLLWLAHKIDAFGHRDSVRKSDAIIVLGTRVLESGQASITLRERVLHAVALQKRGLAPFIITTGGIGDHAPAEGEVAAQLAMRRGVPESQIVIENRSTSTRENLEFAAQICRERGWKRVIIVSQPFHLWRAARYARQFGLQVTVSGVPDSNIDAIWWSRWRWTLREALGAARDWLLG